MQGGLCQVFLIGQVEQVIFEMTHYLFQAKRYKTEQSKLGCSIKLSIKHPIWEKALAYSFAELGDLQVTFSYWFEVNQNKQSLLNKSNKNNSSNLQVFVYRIQKLSIPTPMMTVFKNGPFLASFLFIFVFSTKNH